MLCIFTYLARATAPTFWAWWVFMSLGASAVFVSNTFVIHGSGFQVNFWLIADKFFLNQEAFFFLAINVASTNDDFVAFLMLVTVTLILTFITTGRSTRHLFI